MKLAVWVRRMPWSIVLAATALIGLGWLGLARCDELADGSGLLLRRQTVFSVLAMATMLGLSLPSYRVFCRLSYLAFAVAVELLVLVYAFPEVNNAHRWIRVGPIGLQPSEFAKVAYILAMARYLMYRENYRRFAGLLVPLAMTMLPVLLILKEPDLGTAAILLPVLLVMLFAAGARRGDLLRLAVVGLLLLPVLWSQMSREQRSRVTAVFDQPAAGQRPSDDTYQLYQAKQTLALGGGWGSLVTGKVVEDPAAYALPEAPSDFIFCVVGERLGLPGMALTLGLFAWLAWRGLRIAAATREPFGRLVAVGVVALLAVEVLVNTAMTVGLLPITGLSLPMVSYGGSGLLAHGLALGLLLNVGLRPGYEVTREPFRYAVEG